MMHDDGNAYVDNVRSDPARRWYYRQPNFSGASLFDFGESLFPAAAWLAAAAFSLVAMLAGSTLWVPLLAMVVFSYWACRALQRARQHLWVYPDRLQLSMAEIRFGGRCYLQGDLTDIPVADISGINLRGPGLRIERRGKLDDITLLEGLSSKKKHQFHHLFDVQQRQGTLPAEIAFQAPQVASLPELARIVFSGAVILWLLHTLAL